MNVLIIGTISKLKVMNKEAITEGLHEAWKQGLIMRSIDVEGDGEHLWLSNEIGITNPNFLTYQEWKGK